MSSAIPPPLPVTAARHDEPFLRFLELQQKMKSRTVAALMAIFLPFIGTFYSSALTGVISVVFGVFSVLIYSTGAQIGLFLFLITYISSIFSALKRVELHNGKVIAEARVFPEGQQKL